MIVIGGYLPPPSFRRHNRRTDRTTMLIMTTLCMVMGLSLSLPNISYHHHHPLNPRLTGRAALLVQQRRNLCQWPHSLLCFHLCCQILPSLSPNEGREEKGRGALPSYDSISKTRQNAIIWGRLPRLQRPRLRQEHQSDLGLCPLREKRASAETAPTNTDS